MISGDRILTTHVGRLPRDETLLSTACGEKAPPDAGQQATTFTARPPFDVSL
jgi:hypothetical protein